MNQENKSAKPKTDNEPEFDKSGNVDLNVYSLKSDDEKPTFERPIPEPLPGSDGECFVLTLVGPRSSGKSVVISNLILRDEMMRGLYEEIIIISPTIYSDSTARFLINEVGKDRVYEAYDESIIQGLINSVKDKDRNERQMKLIILDDVIGSIPKYNSLVYNLTSKARHWSISMIISTQNLRELPPVVRNNTTNWAFFRSGNLKEIGKMMEEMGSLGSPDNCYELYKACVEEPHKFMYVDNKFNVYRCFTEHIWSKYTEDGKYNSDFMGENGNVNVENKILDNNIDNELSRK